MATRLVVVLVVVSSCNRAGGIVARAGEHMEMSRSLLTPVVGLARC